MQAIVPTGAANPNGHAQATILAALRGLYGSRRFSFRYDLLDSTNTLVEESLTNVIGCSVSQNWLADIKRTAKFRLADTGEIDYLSDRLKPWIRLHLPPYGASDYVEWPQGVFLLSSPTRSANAAGLVVRDVDAYDLLQVLADNKTADRYTVDASTAYTTAVTTILTANSLAYRLTASTAVLPVAMDWDPGTTHLKIVNDLLDAINYQSLSFDETGTAVIVPYTSPTARVEEWTYADDNNSLTIPGMDQELDLFSVPNKWVLVCSEPDRAAIVGTYTNNDPGSPTSTVSRARTIVDFRTEQQAPDQPTLTQKAYRLAFEASQVYEAIPFATGLNPLHSGNDVLRLTYGPLAIDGKYAEQSWEMDLVAGAPMRHRARRVVSVGAAP